MMKMVQNNLQSDGWMNIIFQHSADVEPRLERLGVAYLLRTCPQVFVVRSRAGDAGGRETMIQFPACNVVQVRLTGGWRPFFFVHRSYGTGVRDCARIGVEAWERARRNDEGGMMNAFVKTLPKGAESGAELGGCHLFEAEWMMPGVVAVG
jgi:hypothetical protein